MWEHHINHKGPIIWIKEAHTKTPSSGIGPIFTPNWSSYKNTITKTFICQSHYCVQYFCPSVLDFRYIVTSKRVHKVIINHETSQNKNQRNKQNLKKKKKKKSKPLTPHHLWKVTHPQTQTGRFGCGRRSSKQQQEEAACSAFPRLSSRIADQISHPTTDSRAS